MDKFFKELFCFHDWIEGNDFDPERSYMDIWNHRNRGYVNYKCENCGKLTTVSPNKIMFRRLK